MVVAPASIEFPIISLIIIWNKVGLVFIYSDDPEYLDWFFDTVLHQNLDVTFK